MQTKKFLSNTFREIRLQSSNFAQDSNFENSYLRNEKSYRVGTFTKISDETRFMKYLNFNVIQGQKVPYRPINETHNNSKYSQIF
jgi:hypothetical protein